MQGARGFSWAAIVVLLAGQVIPVVLVARELPVDEDLGAGGVGLIMAALIAPFIALPANTVAAYLFLRRDAEWRLWPGKLWAAAVAIGGVLSLILTPLAMVWTYLLLA